MTELRDRLAQGEVILLDGATATELQRRGAPMDSVAWSATALLTHPEVVRRVHRDYIEAGADVVITNTFSTARHVLEPAGMGDRVGELNTLAVRLAREARESSAGDRPVAIAGSMSSMVPSDDRKATPSPDAARAVYEEQAHSLAEAGVDLLVLEMMQDVDLTPRAIGAAVGTGLPVWVGWSCKMAPDGFTPMLLEGRDGETFAQNLDSFLPLGGSAMNIMHTEVEDMAPALETLSRHWAGPIGAYPHSGRIVMPNWQFVDMISPEDLVARAQDWVGSGVQIVGTCCGMGPEYTRLLRERLPGHVPSAGGS